MCELMHCPYEVQCDCCSRNGCWEDSDFEDFDDL